MVFLLALSKVWSFSSSSTLCCVYPHSVLFSSTATWHCSRATCSFIAIDSSFLFISKFSSYAALPSLVWLSLLFRSDISSSMVACYPLSVVFINLTSLSRLLIASAWLPYCCLSYSLIIYYWLDTSALGCYVAGTSSSTSELADEIYRLLWLPFAFRSAI
jgi:hypothetical protein